MNINKFFIVFDSAMHQTCSFSFMKHYKCKIITLKPLKRNQANNECGVKNIHSFQLNTLFVNVGYF